MVGISGNTNSQVQEVQDRLRAQRAEQIRTTCINGCRHICGQVLQILPDGLVVDSGYTTLMNPPLNKSWLVRGTVSVTRDPAAIEANSPGAPCIGLIFLTDLPKKPAVNLYDYVTIQGYPAGQSTYVPVPGVQKLIRKFAVRLPTAVRLNLNAEQN